MLALALLLAAGTPADLEPTLREIGRRAQGQVSIAVLHVESGRSVAVNGAKALPLYSVFKLPLAVVVLQDVEAGKLTLEQKVHVTPADVVAGTTRNTERWHEPRDASVRELIGLSISQSDNTSTDVLLKLVGGPGVVDARLQSLGLAEIEVTSSIRDMFARRRFAANRAGASPLVELLAALQRGRVLEPETLSVLIDAMNSAATGLRRLRARLPPGTPVADKTGGGPTGNNDVGLITLPDGTHLAMAVLVRSNLDTAKQEDVIADLGRAAYDAFIAPR